MAKIVKVGGRVGVYKKYPQPVISTFITVTITNSKKDMFYRTLKRSCCR